MDKINKKHIKQKQNAMKMLFENDLLILGDFLAEEAKDREQKLLKNQELKEELYQFLESLKSKKTVEAQMEKDLEKLFKEEDEHVFSLITGVES